MSANPNLKINGIKIDYDPNSFEYEPGEPIVNFFPDTGGNINPAEDLSSAVSMVTFSFRTNGANRAIFNKWKGIKSNSITFSDEGINTSISGAILAEPNATMPFSSDAVFKVTFKGKRAIE